MEVDGGVLHVAAGVGGEVFVRGRKRNGGDAGIVDGGIHGVGVGERSESESRKTHCTWPMLPAMSDAAWLATK